MENPMSWDETTKLIDEALCANNRQDTGDRVLDALAKAGHLKNEKSEMLRKAINNKLSECKELADSGFCGASDATQIKNLLVELGAL